jgi:queuine tRNA-ribosyltransferase
LKFTLLTEDESARLGRLDFARGRVDTPAFMPVGTYGTVKAMTPEELSGLGAQMILGNTFHLWLRPGTAVIEAHGDLHDFTHWEGPILTDSGGFQVYSLGDIRKITEEGVHFRSPVDGSAVFMGPEESMAIQRALGSDVVMIFDECTPYPASEARGPCVDGTVVALGPAQPGGACGQSQRAVRDRAGRCLHGAAAAIARGTDGDRV